MQRKTSSRVAAAACLSLACLLAQAEQPAQDTQPTLHLGSITVTGQQKIVAALLAIKLALKTPFSDDPARADEVVCRINKGLGEQHEYLDCARNRDYRQRRDATQTSVLVGTYGVPDGGVMQMFAAMVSSQPQHALHVPVQGGVLQALLAQLPDDAHVVPSPASVPATGTVPGPSAATSAPTQQL